MKSIDDTLKIIQDITSALPVKLDIAIVGGAAVILHGVERTTIDVAFAFIPTLFSTRTQRHSTKF